MDLLRAKHPEPAHPDRDPVNISSILRPRPQTLQDYWSSDVGAEFLDKWFSIPKICQYFRIRSPVTKENMQLSQVSAVDIYGILSTRYFIMTILTFITLFVRVLFSHLSHSMWRDMTPLFWNLNSQWDAYPEWGGFYLLPLMILFFKHQVSEMVLRIVRRSSCAFMTT